MNNEQTTDSLQSINALLDKTYENNYGDTHVSALFSDGYCCINKYTDRWCAPTRSIATLIIKSYPWIQFVHFGLGRGYTRLSLRQDGIDV